MDEQKPKRERKGYWLERSESGEVLYCHYWRENGKKRIIKRTLSELQEILKGG